MDNLSRRQKMSAMAVSYLIILSSLLHIAESTAPSIVSFSLTSNAQSSSVNVAEGYRLVCVPRVSGDPQPTITFYKDGQVDPQATDTKLIKTISRSDEGLYWIVANNTVGAAISEKITLSVYYINPWTDTDVIDAKTVVEGHALVLDVPVIDANPQPDDTSLTWYTGTASPGSNELPTQLSRNDEYHISTSMQLVLLSTPLWFNGDKQFQAEYSNYYASSVQITRSKRFQLQVTSTDGAVVDPEFVLSLPATSYAQRDGPGHVLECVINAKPLSTLQISWYRQLAGSNTRTQITTSLTYNNRRCTINNFNNGDVYTCEAGSGNKLISSSTAISVIDAPSIEQRMPLVHNVDIGSNLNLPCTVKSNPTATIQWYKNAVPIVSSARLIVQSNGTLSLLNIQFIDTAVYQCVAENSAGSLTDQTHLKLNSAPPSITQPPQNQTMLSGSTAELTCTVAGEPRPDVYWAFKPASGGAAADITTGDRLTVSNTTVRINSAIWSDSGSYQCKANNSLGVADASGVLTVYNSTSIIYKQYPLEERKSSIVERSCMLDKDSRVTAKILWYHDGDVISTDTYRQLVNNNQTLRFNPIRSPSDEGTFTCRVTSIAGNDSTSYSITIIEVPLSVEPQATLASEPRAINVSWIAPDDGNRPITKYSITYKEGSTSENYLPLVDNIPASDRSYIARALRPAKTYQFAVIAHNMLGPSQDTYQTSAVRIPPEAPSAAPTIDSLTAPAPRSINVRFSPPPESEWNSESLRGYNIQHGIALDILNTTNVSALTLSADIDKLLPYQEYWVRVAAYNEVPSEPLYSEKQMIFTLEEAPEVAPVITTFNPVSSTACYLEWSRPDIRLTKGRILGYYVRAFKNTGSQGSVNKTVNPRQQALQHTQIDTLEKFTSYRIEVTVFNSVAESPKDTINCTTLEDRPEAVSQLEVAVYTHDSITVSWDPPSVSNGILKNYSVTYSEPARAGSEQTDSTPYTNYTASGLNSETEYRIEVKATTSIGAGPSKSLTISTRPPPEKPSKASRLEVSNVESRSVLIKFEPGSDGQAPVTRWIVEGKHPEDSDWQVIDTITDPGSKLSQLPVGNLMPFHKYIFRIKAVNIEGESDPSDPTDPVTTKMTNPEAPPANVTVRTQNNSTLIVDWEPLDLALFNGDRASYRVEYKSQYETEDSNWHNATVDNPKKRFYVLEYLNAYTRYRVRVISVNSKYHSDASDEASSTTIEYVPSQGPRINRVTGLGTGVELVWEKLTTAQANGIVLGYKIIYGVVGSNQQPITQNTSERGLVISDLLGYTDYDIQILAFTRIGDGVPSIVPTTKTLMRAPSVPRSLGMQNIQSTSLRLTWLAPECPNSPPLTISYILRYWRSDVMGENRTIPDITALYHDISGLNGAQYHFDLVAVNEEGSSSLVAIMYTVSSPSTHDVPAAPQNFRVLSTSSRNITLKWEKPEDNGLPITNYTLWYRPDTGAFTAADAYIAGYLESYTLKGLSPATKYYFKLSSMNDKGSSDQTMERWNTTSPERPSLSPMDLVVVPKTATSLNLTWTAAARSAWNGALTATRVWYTIYNLDVVTPLDDYNHTDVPFPTSTVMLQGLLAGNLYEVKLGSVNREGHSDPGLPVIIYVGVAVPVGAPSAIGSGEIGGEEITVTWEPINEVEKNGKLLGYKVYYQVMGAPSARKRRAMDDSRQYDLVGPEKTSHTLTDLQTYKQYLITVTAYNLAGEGPSSEPIIATTDQGVPGKVANLSISEVTLDVVNVTWDSPEQPNGILTEYEVTYTPEDDKIDVYASEGRYSTRRPVAHPTTFVELTIPRNTTFNFTVIARTVKGPGKVPVSAVFTTGPRTGAPPAPEMAQYSNEESGILIKWTVSSSGQSEVQGFLVEGLDGDDWQLILRELSTDAEKVTLTSDMLPAGKTFSRFRVSLFNSHGLGNSTEAKEVVPYYKTWWFLVIIALCALVIIIIITAVLCCYCYRMRAKLAEEAYEQDVIGVEGYNTYEMRQSIKRENRGGSKYRAQPPRPSPGAVQYTTDEGPPRYDDSSLTEKGDLSSEEDDAKGNGSVTDSSDDDIDKGATSSNYNNYQYDAYNPYVQSGAVQQSWQNSFGRGRNLPNMYAHTDSEAESSRAPSTSHYRSTNGLLNQSNGSRQHLVNASPDLPGARAPLPGFSSFV